VQPAREAEGNGKGRVGVADDVPEGVVVDSLHHGTGRVRHHVQRAHLIAGQIIPIPAPGHGDGHSFDRL
jgi:hypothetical protein